MCTSLQKMGKNFRKKRLCSVCAVLKLIRKRTKPSTSLYTSHQEKKYCKLKQKSTKNNINLNTKIFRLPTSWGHHHNHHHMAMVGSNLPSVLIYMFAYTRYGDHGSWLWWHNNGQTLILTIEWNYNNVKQLRVWATTNTSYSFVK